MSCSTAATFTNSASRAWENPRLDGVGHSPRDMVMFAYRIVSASGDKVAGSDDQERVSAPAQQQIEVGSHHLSVFE